MGMRKLLQTIPPTQAGGCLVCGLGNRTSPQHGTFQACACWMDRFVPIIIWIMANSVKSPAERLGSALALHYVLCC